ncbi:MAG: glycosyltransferase family 9 protein, partial [Selenomonas sp.]|nr:glycosyltransferase family 9 protein [Selenomonas sp.]
MQNKTTAVAESCRILIIRLSAIGDVLHATTVARHLKGIMPGCHLTWLVSPPADKMLEGNPYIDEILLWDRRPLDPAVSAFDLGSACREIKKARALLKP